MTNTSHPIIITDGQDLEKGGLEGGKIKPGEKEVVKWKYIFNPMLCGLLLTAVQKMSPQSYKKFISSMLQVREAGHCLIRLTIMRAVLY